MALDALPQAVLICDRSGVVLSRNAAAEAMLPPGENIGSVLEADGPPRVDWRSELAVAEVPGGSDHRDVVITGRGDRQLTVDVYIRALCPTGAGGGDSAAALVAVEDVSARVSMERRLAASERLAAVGKLAATVAHELNNPLDGVLRYVGLAERDAGEDQREYLRRARTGLLRMAGIIRDLLDQTRAGRTGGARTSIGKLIEEAADVMQPRARAIGVAIVCGLVEEASIPVGAELFQVFCNVMKNALDAMPDGGLLRICLRREASDIVVTFADTGVGLGAQDARRMFQPFYTTKPAGQGSGLGLAVCREILSQCGGSIAAAPGPEGGAIVTIRVPVLQPAGAE